VVEVDTQGVVTSILSITTPASLFGFEPLRLMGRSLGEVVDVLQVETLADEVLSAGAKAAYKDKVAQAMLEMAAQSMEVPGVSWWVQEHGTKASRPIGLHPHNLSSPAP
jgi:hypothetical protein